MAPAYTSERFPHRSTRRRPRLLLSPPPRRFGALMPYLLGTLQDRGFVLVDAMSICDDCVRSRGDGDLAGAGKRAAANCQAEPRLTIAPPRTHQRRRFPARVRGVIDSAWGRLACAQSDASQYHHALALRRVPHYHGPTLPAGESHDVEHGLRIHRRRSHGLAHVRPPARGRASRPRVRQRARGTDGVRGPGRGRCRITGGRGKRGGRRVPQPADARQSCKPRPSGRAASSRAHARPASSTSPR